DNIYTSPLLALKWIGYMLILIGLGLQIYSFFKSQRNPSEKDVNKVLNPLLKEQIFWRMKA
ncbi:MAG: hypothetical protein JSV32_02930, partial [Dehalococcoidia bacterium]